MYSPDLSLRLDRKQESSWTLSPYAVTTMTWALWLTRKAMRNVCQYSPSQQHLLCMTWAEAFIDFPTGLSVQLPPNPEFANLGLGPSLQYVFPFDCYSAACHEHLPELFYIALRWRLPCSMELIGTKSGKIDTPLCSSTLCFVP